VAALVASSVVAILPYQEIYHLVRNSDDKTVVKITIFSSSGIAEVSPEIPFASHARHSTMYMAKAKFLETLEIHEEPVLSAGRLIGFAWVSLRTSLH